MSNVWTKEEAAHLLNRAGFGGSPAEFEAIHAKGREGAVEWLLEAHAPSVEKPAWAGQRSEIEKKFMELRQQMRGKAPHEREKEGREIQQRFQREQREQGLSLLNWWMNVMVSTQAPLREKMVFFWHDHFVSSSQKVKQPKLMLQQNELFRQHALGNFGTLTKEIITDPAMMIYLDSAQSKKSKPNENFARELMELFTLGEGNYTEEDVREAARAFTGYRLDRLRGEVTHLRRQWDDGEKIILGEKAAFDGQGVVELLLKKPPCANYLAGKIFAYFAFENPSAELTQRFGQAFAKAKYELKPLLREIFLCEEFYCAQAMRTRIKSPVEYLIMLCKQLEVSLPPERLLFSTLERLGQVPFLPPNVAGWDWGKAWVNTNTLITRYHVAGLLTGAGGDPLMAVGEKGAKFTENPAGKRRLKSRLPQPHYEQIAPRELREDVPALIAHLAWRIFQAPLREKDQHAFENYADAKKGVIFTNTEVAELIHLMMSTPAYQLC